MAVFEKKEINMYTLFYITSFISFVPSPGFVLALGNTSMERE